MSTVRSNANRIAVFVSLVVATAGFTSKAQGTDSNIPPLPPPPFSTPASSGNTGGNTFEFIRLRSDAEKGDAGAQCELGIRYGKGNGIEKDADESVKWLRKSAEQNNARAQYFLGAAYYFGAGLTADYAQAAIWFRKSAEQNYAEAQASLGACYLDGKGVSKDEVEAHKWMEKAAAQGNKDAEKNLATLNKRRAYQAAEPSSPSGAPQSGAEGITTRELPPVSGGSSQTGFPGLKAKAEAGDAFAQAQVGIAYIKGDGVRKDLAEGVKWFRKAAEKSDAAGQYNLGVCYATGLGVRKDQSEAFKWYTKAAQQNYLEAEFNLGCAYFYGQGVKKDSVTAAKLFHRAALRNDPTAQSILGYCYTNGIGVPRDDVQAYKWSTLAAARDIPEAKGNLASLERKMARPEIVQGQKLAREFRPTAEGSNQGGSSGSTAGNGTPRLKGTGTGFFITEDGYLITNFHVVKGGTEFRLATNGGKISARLIKGDPEIDLALLKADGQFVRLAVASSRGVKLGDTVATVGFPDPGLQGYAPKYTRGEINSLSGVQDNDRTFQISTQIYPGNSGGALVDERGNVVGVTSSGLNYKAAMKASGRLLEGVNYAIKSSFVLSFLESIPDVSSKLKEANTDENKPSDVIEDMQKAAALVMVYSNAAPEQTQPPAE